MNHRERAQRMVAMLTQSLEADWSNPETIKQLSVFEGEEVAQIQVPDVEGLTMREACVKSIGAGFAEGWKFARVAIELIAVAGKLIDENDPAVDFRHLLHVLGMYAAALPDEEE